MSLRHWSTSASGNASTAGINWQEGQAPSTVNNSAREEMAQVRRQYTPAQWHWVEVSNTASVASQTSFKLATDLTADFHAGRRVRLSGGSTTRYASIVSSSYTAETAVTIAPDSGSLSASHSIAALGPAVAGSPLGAVVARTGDTMSGSLVVQAGAAPQLKALHSGTVSIEAQTTGAGQQARLQLTTPTVTWMWYTNGGEATLHQVGVGDRLRVNTDGSVEVVANVLYPRAGILDIGNISSFNLASEGGVPVIRLGAGDHNIHRSGNQINFIIAGSGEARVEASRGMRSSSNAKVFVDADVASATNAYNVSSITHNGTGDYTVSFTSALADGNYTVVGTARTTAQAYVLGDVARSATQVQIQIRNNASDALTDDRWAIAIFRTGL